MLMLCSFALIVRRVKSEETTAIENRIVALNVVEHIRVVYQGVSVDWRKNNIWKALEKQIWIDFVSWVAVEYDQHPRGDIGIVELSDETDKWTDGVYENPDDADRQ